ncbi:MAG: hypothetical protein M1815_001163 [Lichina confinis]|nr:MAG: hypothetical protein M1815_001163 [Lichina confinis]
MADSPTSMFLALSPANTISHSPGETNQLSPQSATFTHKEWVVPPRPKPGRKPATDVPPTKRKAQNRAAQRAFRERRAAKVEELEEQMREREATHVQERGELASQITRLEAEVERFREEVLAWRSKSQELEQDVLRERSLREQVEGDLSGYRDVSQPSRRMDISPSRQDPSANGRQLQTTASRDYDLQDDGTVAMGCGDCTEDSRCECLEQVINMSTSGMMQGDLDMAPKQSHSGEGGSHGHDQGSSSRLGSSDSLETDFTGLFARDASKQRTGVIGSRSPQQQASPSMAISSSATDSNPCGFCESGTPCICAQMESSRQRRSVDVTRAPMSFVISRFTPPPADGDVCRVAEPSRTSRAAQPQIGSFNSPNDTCAGGPGTCAQCRADPNSTIFCKSLAATAESSRGGAAGAAGAGAGAADADTGCCQSGLRPGPCRGRNPATASSSPKHTPSRKEGTVYLSCADTYITLSRHPHYQEATDELDSWLGKLKTTLPPGETDRRPAIEIEAASVMGVLKFFDRRFGRE